MTRRFMIIAHARSGSTAVETALDSHPEIRCWPELLHPNVERLGFSVRPIRDGEPVSDYLENEVFSEAGKAAIGFRVLNSHLQRTQEGRDYLNALKGRADIDVVFLERRYLLDALLSQVRAELRRGYTFYGGDVPDAYYEPFEVDAQDLADRVRRIRWQLADLRKRTSSLRRLALVYEDFEDDVTIGAARIVDFLGLEQAPLTVGTTRIGRVRPNEVKNLDELLAAFQGPALSGEFDHGYWMGR